MGRERGDGVNFVVEVGFKGRVEGVHQGEKFGAVEGLGRGEIDEVVVKGGEAGEEGFCMGDVG